MVDTRTPQQAPAMNLDEPVAIFDIGANVFIYPSASPRRARAWCALTVLCPEWRDDAPFALEYGPESLSRRSTSKIFHRGNCMPTGALAGTTLMLLYGEPLISFVLTTL
jgi:hypothetical protein